MIGVRVSDSVIDADNEEYRTALTALVESEVLTHLADVIRVLSPSIAIIWDCRGEDFFSTTGTLEALKLHDRNAVDFVSEELARRVNDIGQFIGVNTADGGPFVYHHAVMKLLRTVGPSEPNVLKANEFRQSLGEALRALSPVIATLNYDSVLDDYLARVPINMLDPTVKSKINHMSRFVYHLHGVWNQPAGFTLGPSEYIANAKKFRNALFLLLDPPEPPHGMGTSRSMVFVGVGEGMFDSHMLPVLQELQKLCKEFDRDTKHYWLVRNNQVEEYRVRLGQLGIDIVNVVGYGDEYGDLAPFLWRASHRESSSPTTISIRDNPSEDWRQVRVTRDNDGLPVLTAPDSIIPPSVDINVPGMRTVRVVGGVSQPSTKFV